MSREPLLKDVPLRLIYERENLSRDYYGRIDQLAEAIKENDWVDTLIVLEDKSKDTLRYGLVAGYRRFRACNILVERGDWAESATVPCQVFTSLSDAAAAALNCAENQQRLEPNYAEFFKVCHELKERYGFGSEEIGKRLNGMSASHINNCARAHKQLHPVVLASLAKGNKSWSLSKLFALASKPKESQLKVWQTATAVKRAPDELEPESGEPIVQRASIRRRRDIELAIKDLKRKGDDTFLLVVETLQWVLGERSEPW